MGEHVRESIKEVDENTWLIGGLILHRSKDISHTCAWYDRKNNFSYTVTGAPAPPPPAIPLTANNPTIKLVYEAGDSSAVWSLGDEAFCKVKLRVLGTTPEAMTLDFVHTQWPDLEIPNVLHHSEHDHWSYLFVSRVPGRTLADAWSTLNESWKHHYVQAVVEICQSLQLLERASLGGVDGGNIPERYLIQHGAVEDFSPPNLQRGCESIGMDCSKYVFYHADLGPGNIIVECVPHSGKVGIVDWETAGFYPREWIRTKFRVSSGLNLPASATDTPRWWRSEVQKLLEKRGFGDLSEEWFSWWEGQSDSKGAELEQAYD